MSVLIVDHPPDSEGLRALVGMEGYAVDVVCSTAEAVQRLQAGGVQLVLCELRARDIDAWDLLAAARQVSPQTHVVYLLPNVNDEVEEVLRTLDVDGHLLKPVEEERLQALLHALLDADTLDRTTEAFLFLPRTGCRLIVEDALTDAGVYSEPFDDLRALAATLKGDPPHIVIVDVGPGSAEGFAVCEAVRQVRAYIPSSPSPSASLATTPCAPPACTSTT